MALARFSSHASPSPKIIMLKADARSQAAWRSWCVTHGFDVTRSFSGKPIQPTEFDFHLTLLASTNPITLPASSRSIPPFTLEPCGFTVLGQKTPTAVLAPTAYLTDRRDWIITTYGIVPTYPSFRPHISLSYNWDGHPLLNILPLPPSITFDRCIVRVFED
jgi:hypothetical protein